MEDNSKDKFRDSIGDLLSELPDEVPGLDNTPELPKVRLESTQAVALTKAKGKAKKVMSSLLKFYLSEEIIAEHEYIQAKSNLDEYALGMLIRQMENSEVAISQLMDIINEGDVSPRMFEVLSDLQRTLLDIIKSQTMYMVAIEENAKKTSRDIDVYHGNSESSGNKKQSGVKSRGTKDLMRALQETINEEDIQDVDSDENEQEYEA
tara:strand:- start:1435 stop:2055 length:621 start_codon:yes stop_codon:yes gene_type:complete